MKEQQIASLWSRVGGALIDFIIVMLVSFVICFIWGFYIGLSGAEKYLSNVEIDAQWKVRGMLVGLLVDGIYTVVMMTGDKQSTYGQRAVGIRIVKDDGTTIGYGTAIGRWITSLFSSILLKIGFLIAIFTTNKKTLHDLLAGTIVIVAEKQATAKNKISIKNNNEKFNVNELYLEALDEYESEKRDRALYARLVVESGGDEEKVKARYIETKVESKLNESNASEQKNIEKEKEESITGWAISSVFKGLLLGIVVLYGVVGLINLLLYIFN